MSDKPKRRWYQFSLRMLLAAVTLAAVGSAWWKHRNVCLEQCRFHAQRNAACANRMFGGNKDSELKNDGWIDLGPQFLTASFINGSDNYSYNLQHSPTSSGYDTWFLTVESGKLPAAEQRIQTELTHEAELADQYFHAIWRPWERFWIDETP